MTGDDIISTALNILFTVLIFGFLIFIHEFGHFIAARWSGVKVDTFAIGMGPTIFKIKGKKTTYKLNLLPIGGYCAMKGEIEDADGEDSFGAKPIYKRIIICGAGAFMNIAVAFLCMFILVGTYAAIPSMTIGKFTENATSNKTGLEIGDTFIKIDNININSMTDFSLAIMRSDAQKGSDVVVIRDGEKITLNSVKFPSEVAEDGTSYITRDFLLKAADKNLFSVIKYGYFNAVAVEKMVFVSLGDLLTGKVALNQLSGPVGVTSVIGEAAKYGWDNVLFIAILISINLGIMNLLPFPALDGGRIVLLIVEKIRGKKIKPEIEGVINFVGLALLMLLMVVVTISDISKIF